MNIVVIGGTGLIGSKLVAILRQRGHDVIAASPASGVNSITGEGLDEVLKGADVVVDVANSPSLEGEAALEFFETAGRHLLPAEAKAGVKHHVALSVVGTERLVDNGYFRAKAAQERLIRESKIPYTIVHSTQFFEFVSGIVKAGTEGDTVRISPALIQPIASEDVAAAIADYTLGSPINGVVEIAGPERIRLSDLAQRYLRSIKDSRKVVPDVHARYYGTELTDETLVPGENPRLGNVSIDSFLART
jgi:uncharacterized protein YbjT (DUF2867 family)